MSKTKDQPDGLQQRYRVTRLDGSPCDEGAVYFVLRLDDGCSDEVHLRACRDAAIEYGVTTLGTRMEHVGLDLMNLVEELSGESTGVEPPLPCDRRCPKCGSDDAHREFVTKNRAITLHRAAHETQPSNEFARVEASAVPGQSLLFALKDCLTHMCRCCGFRYETDVYQR